MESQLSLWIQVRKPEIEKLFYMLWAKCLHFFIKHAFSWTKMYSGLLTYKSNPLSGHYFLELIYYYRVHISLDFFQNFLTLAQKQCVFHYWIVNTYVLELIWKFPLLDYPVSTRKLYGQKYNIAFSLSHEWCRYLLIFFFVLWYIKNYTHKYFRNIVHFLDMDLFSGSFCFQVSS